MIHLHSSLLSSETNTSKSGQNSSAPSGDAKLDSFHGALSDAVSSTLEKFGIHADDVKISITRATADAAPASTNSGTSTRTTPPTPGTPASNSSSTGTASDSTSSQAPDNGYDPFLQAAYSNPYANAPAQTSTKSSTVSTAPTLDAQQIFDNTYWANQPAAVQPLRTMQSQSQRAQLATQLANEGYSIDVPIMVWGWDPSTTMSMREAEGYTWVPSALQNSVAMAPGLPSTGTTAAYDPNSPPAGSIAV